jgi:hypothetical protein
MKYNYLILLVICVLIIIIFYSLNSIQEKYTNYATNYCVTDNDILGIRLSDGSCVPFNSDSSTTKKSTQIKPDSTSGTSYSGLSRTSNTGSTDTGSSDYTSVNNVTTDQTECVIKNSDYGQVCKNRFGSQSGVEKIEKCDNESVKVKCRNMYFNGKNYTGENTFSTDCFDKTLDFDALCNQYMPDNIKNSSRPNGYNINSAGVSEKLHGIDGSCYLNNGESDTTKVRGICNLRSDQTLPRLSPFTFTNNKEINDYNKFTDCKNIETGNFVQTCKNLLNIDENDVYADINGYDCLPGYGRAKCVNKEKDLKLSPDMKKFKIDSRSRSLYPYTISD